MTSKKSNSDKPLNKEKDMPEDKWPWSCWQALSQPQRARLKRLYPRETANLDD